VTTVSNFTGSEVPVLFCLATPQLTMRGSISAKEVQKHNKFRDLWLVIDGTVYDFTEFAPEHPGGAASKSKPVELHDQHLTSTVILKEAGRDASETFLEVHPLSLLKHSLPASKILGRLDTSTIDSTWSPPLKTPKSTTDPMAKPPLSSLLNTHDFEDVASSTLSEKAWAFYSSAATDLHTKKRNTSTYSRIGLRPRILTNVRDVSTKTTMLGQKLNVPIFACPTAIIKLVHPDGEKAIGRACKKVGIPQTVSTNASFPIEEIFEGVKSGPYGADEAADPNQDGQLPIFFQLYVDKERAKSEALLAKAERLGAKAVFLTVDAPVPGKREADERIQADETLSVPMSGAKAVNDSKGGSLGRIMGGFVDASVSWADIPWLRKTTSLPIILKGVQTAADARLAVQHGIDGIILSNHGGRSLDTSPASILVLLELQRNCPEVFDSLEVFVDGGIYRGTDIFKALCLGARAVGIGRGFLYAVNYGAEGVEKYVDSRFNPIVSFFFGQNGRAR
jgi:L-lactate dehydrogenase (cytochrome)